ncbi:hypothetical protein GCM10011387_31770 [Pedobacter quisquiliarum]|uniref:Uncharacterized protein n=1 Tax=Pedobacter quisquiliarum TaxID=1834438 RepID=A0A916UJR1_9SPHI|nr:hypothetical protein GCM10011387_31770 [Pedobacter quisquiliarum]
MPGWISSRGYAEYPCRDAGEDWEEYVAILTQVLLIDIHLNFITKKRAGLSTLRVLVLDYLTHNVLE